MHKLLIADDEQIECLTLEKMIAARFPQLQLLPSVGDGVSLIRSIEKEQPDIVITDINMPGMTGLEALELLHERHPHMQMIINTAYSDFSFAQRAIKCGAIDYVLKPCNKESILHAVALSCQKLDNLGPTKSGLSMQQISDIADMLALKLSQQAAPADVQEPAVPALHLDTEKSQTKNPHIKKAMAYIRSQYMHDISLDDVASACGISSFYLSRMFKQALNINFISLLTDIRMEAAVKLLEQGDLSNTEIAAAVGYASVSYFHKVFRRKTGMTLGDYREAIGLSCGDTQEEDS